MKLVTKTVNTRAWLNTSNLPSIDRGGIAEDILERLEGLRAGVLAASNTPIYEKMS